MKTELSCFVVDDQSHGIDLLKFYIEDTPGLAFAGSATNPLLAAQSISRLKPDITFIDIDMPKLSGVELARLVKDDTIVVFSTAHQGFAVSAIEEAIMADYLLKPYGYERFLKAIVKIKKILQLKETNIVQMSPDPGYLYLPGESKGKFIRILYDDITHAMSLHNYSCIFLSTKSMLVYITLKDLEERLPRQFLRVHKSYIINLDRIASLDGNAIILDNKTEITVSNSYKKQFFESIQDKMLSNKRPL